MNNTIGTVDMQTLHLASLLLQAQTNAARPILPLPKMEVGPMKTPPSITKRTAKTACLPETEKLKRRRLQIAAASRKSRAKRKQELQNLREENSRLIAELEKLKENKQPKIFDAEDALASFLDVELKKSLNSLRDIVALKSGSTDKVFDRVEKHLDGLFKNEE